MIVIYLMAMKAKKTEKKRKKKYPSAKLKGVKREFNSNLMNFEYLSGSEKFDTLLYSP